MKWFVLSILIAPVLSSALLVQNQPPPGTTTISASTNRFAFAQPNETTPEQAIQQLGERFSDYTAYLLEGKINPFPITGFTRISQTYAEARRLRVKVIEARVLTWQVPEWKWEQATLIFNGGKLWYAIYPPPPSDSTPEQLTPFLAESPSIPP